MNTVFDWELLRIIEALNMHKTHLFGTFVGFARVLAAGFAMIYLSYEAYKMLSGDKQLEVLPLLRPFALGLVIIFWVQLIPIVDAPANAMTGMAREGFREQVNRVEAQKTQRRALQAQLMDALTTRSSEARQADEQRRNLLQQGMDRLGVEFRALSNMIDRMQIWVVAQIRNIVNTIIEFLAALIWKICVMIVFYLQVFFSTILVILGPLAVAFSILPSFRDAWVQWLARYISISLYGVIAFINLTLAMTIMEFGISVEIHSLQQVLADVQAGNRPVGGYTMQVMTAGHAGDGALIVTSLIGALAMLTVPTISTWVIQTSGAGQAAMALGGGIAGAIWKTTKAAGVAATKGAAVVASKGAVLGGVMGKGGGQGGGK